MSPLTSFDPTPNAAHFTSHISVLDGQTGTAWPLDDIKIEMEIVDQNGCRRLYGSTDDGKLIPSGDGFDFTFPASEMRTLCAGSYTVNVLATDTITGFVQEPFIYNLPVLDGGFR